MVINYKPLYYNVITYNYVLIKLIMYYSQCYRALLHTYKHDSVTDIAYGTRVIQSKE